MTTEAETKAAVADQSPGGDKGCTDVEDEEKKEVDTVSNGEALDNPKEAAPSGKKRTLDEATDDDPGAENGGNVVANKNKTEPIKDDGDKTSSKGNEGHDEPASKRKKADEEGTKKKEGTSSSSSNGAPLFGSLQGKRAPSFENPFAAALKKASGEHSSGSGAGAVTKGSSIFGGNVTHGTSLFGKGGFGSSSSSSTVIGGASSSSNSSMFGSSSGVGTGPFGSRSPFSSSSSSSLLWAGNRTKASTTSSNGSPSVVVENTTAPADSMTTATASTTTNTTSLQSSTAAAAAESISNGEENEFCVLQCRAKLYRLVSTSASSSSSDNNKEGGVSTDWKEVGIGPLRLLKTTAVTNNDSLPSKKTDDAAPLSSSSLPSASYRLVQRRECTPGGLGTKLILNITIGKDLPCTVSRQSDKYLRLATVCCSTEATAGGEPQSNTGKEASKREPESVTYLFKFKTGEEVNDLLNKINEILGLSSPTSDKDKSINTDKEGPVKDEKNEK